MNYSQQNSVFVPGLTRRGPVYNVVGPMGGLPSLSPGIKFAIEAGLIAAGIFKKLPLPLAIAGAFAVYQLFPDSTTGSVANASTPAAPIDTSSLLQVPAFDASGLPMPSVGIPQ
jgi:hypothetical protein